MITYQIEILVQHQVSAFPDCGLPVDFKISGKRILVKVHHYPGPILFSDSATINRIFTKEGMEITPQKLSTKNKA